MVYDVLKRAGRPLHVNEIIDRVEKLHGRKLERESIVSMLVKKIARGERFVRTDKRVRFQGEVSSDAHHSVRIVAQLLGNVFAIAGARARGRARDGDALRARSTNHFPNSLCLGACQ